MKNDELKAILEDDTADLTSKIAKIQALNGVDIKVQQDKKNAEIDTLKGQFESEKTSWETEKSKYKEYVSKDDHQKVLDELNGYKEKEENSRRATYLKSLGCKDNYSDLLSSKIDWSKASFDSEKNSYVGDEFSKNVEEVKKTYPDLFEGQKDTNIQIKGYYGSIKQVSDLTDL